MILIQGFILSAKDKNHKDIDMKIQNFFLAAIAINVLALILNVFFLIGDASAQTQFYASCESPNEIILQKNACNQRFNDCLPAPNLGHNFFKLKCVETLVPDYDKPIYSKDCPEGEISHVEKVCDTPELISKDKGENCTDVEVMCEPESYELVGKMVLVEDVDLVEQERSAQIQREEKEENMRRAFQAWKEESFIEDGRVINPEEARERARNQRGGK